MAVTGKLQADFASFYSAVDQAEVKLRSFESGSAKVESQLSRMVDGFSGRRVISEATLMAEAIERSGGVSKLTASELERAGATAAQAAEKMRALGIEVPKGINDLASSAENAGGKVGGLGKTFNQFDNALSAVGLHLGPELRGISELGDAAGKTATELGLLATAGLSVAAFAAGLKIGSWIDEWTGWSKSISQATAALLGWGDAAAQKAGAGADVLALASERAGRQITSMAEAIKINKEWVDHSAASYVDWAGRMAIAQAKLDDLTPAQIKQIELAQKLHATNAQLEHDFGVTADVLVLLTDKLNEATDAGVVWGDGANGIKADIDALDAAGRELATGGLSDVIGSLGEMVTSFDALDPAMNDYIDQLQRAQNYEKAMADGLVIIGQEAQSTTQSVMSFSEAMDAVAHGQGTLSATIQAGPRTEDMKARTQQSWNEGRYFGPVLNGTQTNPQGTGPDWQALGFRASGGPVSAGSPYMVGERGPELFVPERSGTIVPNGAGGNVTVNIHVDGSILSTAAQLRDVVGGAVLDIFRSGALALPG